MVINVYGFLRRNWIVQPGNVRVRLDILAVQAVAVNVHVDITARVEIVPHAVMENTVPVAQQLAPHAHRGNIAHHPQHARRQVVRVILPQQVILAPHP